MLNWFKNNRQARQIAAGIAAVAIIVGLFSIGPVRALASDFLGLFRVESFVAVDIDPERMAEVAEALDGGLLIGDMEMINEPAEPEMVASVAEASARVGFTPRTLSGYGDPTIVLVSDDMQVRFTPDLETMRMLFDTLEISTDALPSEADGKPFEVVVPGGVVFMYSDGDPDMSKDVVLTQVPSPTVDTPDDVDVRDLSIAALQVMGLSRPEAERLSQSIDLTTTLVLPIPSAFASVEEVRVDGTRGLLVNSLEGAGSILLWQKDGIVMVIMADSGSVDLVDIAEQLD